MRYRSELYTYTHYPQRKKKSSKKRKKDYYYFFNLYNPEGTDHLLLTLFIIKNVRKNVTVRFSTENSHRHCDPERNEGEAISNNFHIIQHI